MSFARTTATLFVVLFIGLFCLAGIVAGAWFGPMAAHGTTVMHAAGRIIEVGPGKNFVLQTSNGTKMFFMCDTTCRASLRHLTRHLKEKANTDIYYIQGPGTELVAKDAD